jgi:hypothetical protein
MFLKGLSVQKKTARELQPVNPFDFITPTDGGKNATHMRGD